MPRWQRLAAVGTYVAPPAGPRAGYAKAGLVGSGARVSTSGVVLTKAGFGKLMLAGYGTNALVSVEKGYGAAGAVGAGTGETVAGVVFTKAGYGTLRPIGAGVADTWITVVKASDESVTSSTVPQDDNELFFATTAAAVYEFAGAIIYGSPAGAGTPDLKTVWGEDSTIRGFVWLGGVSNTDANFTGYAQTNQTATIILGTLAADRHAPFVGVHVANGATFKLQWAQNVSGGNATIIRAGSFIRYRRVN